MSPSFYSINPHQPFFALKLHHLSAFVGDLDFFSVMFKCFNLVMKGLIKWQKKDVLGFYSVSFANTPTYCMYVNILFKLELNKPKVH